MSEHLSQQQEQRGGGCYGGPLRYPNTCMLWVQCQAKVLEERIRVRVEKMIESGLLNELEDFHLAYNTQRLQSDEDADYERGIFQSIGFKEFHEYLVCDDEIKQENPKLFEQSVEKMKVATWKYAKYQVKWITKRLVNRMNSLQVYPLNGDKPDRWDDLVYKPALLVIKNFFANHPNISEQLHDVDCNNILEVLPMMPKPSNLAKERRTLKKCKICGDLYVQNACWEAHIKSKKHLHNVRLLKKNLSTTVEILDRYSRTIK